MLPFNRRLIHAAVWLVAMLPLSGTIAAEDTATGNAAIPINSETQRQQRLVEDSNAGSMVWLDSEQTVVGRFDAAVQPYQMAILGLTSDAQSLHRPALLDALHAALPIQGWHMLSVLMPSPEMPADNTSDPDNADTKQVDDAATSIKAALAFLREQQVQSVSLVCNQQQLAAAIAMATAEKDFVSGLVLWDVDYRALAPQQLEALKQSRVSILDLQSSGNKRQQQQWRRQYFARANFIEDYKLVDSSALLTDTIAIKRVRHWLESEFRKY